MSSSPPGPSYPSRVGERVEMVEGELFHLGTILFQGPVPAGSETCWFGIEWDNPARGKHSGVHQDIHYFTTSVPNSGSFVKTTSRQLRFARDFETALTEKYVPTVNVQDEQIMFGGSSKIEVETVGWHKIVAKQSQLQNLSEVGLAQLQIGYCCTGSSNNNSNNNSGCGGGDDGFGSPVVPTPTRTKTIAEMCPKVTDIDLSKNLFRTWDKVAEICKCLPRLSSLRLNYNRFTVDSMSSPSLPGCFAAVTVLSLNGTMLSWQEVEKLNHIFPSLEELHLGFNNISLLLLPTSSSSSSSTAFPQQSFQKLRLLNLESNVLSSWSDIYTRLSVLPLLKTLVLNNNSILSIDSCKDAIISNNYNSTDSELISAFPSLRFLNLNYNQVNDWTSVHNLNSYSNLNELRFKSNPVLSTITGSIDDVHCHLIGRLSNLVVLNGSNITMRSRKDAEIYYLNQCVKVKSGMELADFAKLHPRFSALVEQHGDPTPAPLHLTSSSLKDRLLSLNLVFESLDNKAFEKKIPMTMTIRNLKALAGRVGSVRGVIKLKSKSLEDGMETDLDDDLKVISYYGVKHGDSIFVLV